MNVSRWQAGEDFIGKEQSLFGNFEITLYQTERVFLNLSWKRWCCMVWYFYLHGHSNDIILIPKKLKPRGVTEEAFCVIIHPRLKHLTDFCSSSELGELMMQMIMPVSVQLHAKKHREINISSSHHHHHHQLVWLETCFEKNSLIW